MFFNIFLQNFATKSFVQNVNGRKKLQIEILKKPSRLSKIATSSIFKMKAKL
jgi:hypothetical protein